MIVHDHHFRSSFFKAVVTSVFSAAAQPSITLIYPCLPYQWNKKFCKLKYWMSECAQKQSALNVLLNHCKN